MTTLSSHPNAIYSRRARQRRKDGTLNTGLREKAIRDWPPEREARLLELIADGKTGGQIATALGVSRGAVMGKIGRMGAKLQASKKNRSEASAAGRRKRYATSRPEPKLAPKPRWSAPKIVAVPYVPETGVPFLQLARGQCKWALGDQMARAVLFCGQPASDGKPYCAHHARRAIATHRPTMRRPYYHGSL